MIWFSLFVRLSVHPYQKKKRKIWEILPQFCLIFCMKLDVPMVRNWLSQFLWKGHEKPKKSPKWYFCGFDVTLIHSYVLFLFEYEITNVLLTFCPLTFCKSHISGKNLVLDLWSENLKTNQNAQKTSRPITMQNSLVCNVSQAS